MTVPPPTPESAGPATEVAPLELFFDLVFVLAISQLSHHLRDHLTWRGTAETAVMLLAVLTVWSFTSWVATMIPAGCSTTREMMLAVMLLGLFMNASITRAFAGSGWAFAIPLLVIQLGRTLWTIAVSPDAFYREHFRRTLIWFVATTPLWIVGAWAAPRARLSWWAAAAGLDLVGTWLAHAIPGRRLHSVHVAFDADHILERCRLFLIIALGETVLTTGVAIAGAPMAVMTLVTGTCALAGTVALWSLGFGRSNRLIQKRVQTTDDPIRLGRHAINALMAMVAGLIAVAVANELAIGHPHEHGPAALRPLLFGGPVVFLAAQGWYLRSVLQLRARMQLWGCAALLAAGLVTLAAPAYVALLVVAGCLTTLTVTDAKSLPIE